MKIVENILTRLISKELKNDTLYLLMCLKSDCCMDVEPIINYKDDKLFLDIDKRGRDSEIIDICDCICSHELMLVISGINDLSFKTFLGTQFEITVKEEKYKTFPIKYEIDKGDTINMTNKYGYPTGIWRYYVDSVLLIEEDYSDNSYLRNTPISSKSFYSNGNLKTFSRENEKIHYYLNGHIKTTIIKDSVKWFSPEGIKISKRNIDVRKEYYPSGQLKKSISKWNELIDNKVVKRSKTRYWDENGVEIINGVRMELKKITSPNNGS